MFSSLDASNFSGSIPFYDKEFEKILSKITVCYQLMKTDSVSIENDENKLRDYLLLNYLKNNKIRNDIDLLDWHFEREIQEDHSKGRTDIKIISQNTFLQQEAYYIIECKRLNNINTTGTSGLNAEYIKNGVERFIGKYYSSHYRVNALIGFVVDKIDIHQNTLIINSLLTQSFTTITTKKEITKDNFIDDFEFHYHSIHLDKDNDELKIYHLMLDLHENISNKN